MAIADDTFVDISTLNPTTDVTNIDFRNYGSPTEQFGDNNGATRKVRVPWSQRWGYVVYFLGQGGRKTISGTQRLSRQLPQQYPGRPGWFAVRVPEIKGFGLNTNDTTEIIDGTRVSKYISADLTIDYDQVNYAVVDDTTADKEYKRYTVTGEIRPSAEFLQMPSYSLRYAVSGGAVPDGIQINYGVGRILPLEEFTYTWRRVPYSCFQPGSALYTRIYGDGTTSNLPYLGTVNKTAFAGRPKGTVLFSGMRPIRIATSIGTLFEWDIEYTFTYDPNKWNYKLYQPVGGGGGSFYYVSRSGTAYSPGSVPDGDSLYNERELHNLWSVVALAGEPVESAVIL